MQAWNKSFKNWWFVTPRPASTSKTVFLEVLSASASNDFSSFPFFPKQNWDLNLVFRFLTFFNGKAKFYKSFLTNLKTSSLEYWYFKELILGSILLKWLTTSIRWEGAWTDFGKNCQSTLEIDILTLQCERMWLFYSSWWR